ncbi:MAG: glutamyl-tRNA reductase [Actinomycetota bacterium]
MPIVVVGLNHKTAPIALLDRLSITESDLSKALHQLETYERVDETVVLSTCNRIEVYAAVTKFHGGAQDLRNFFAEFCHIAPEDFTDHLYTYHDEGAVRHLFRVAAGVDSMVIGESEILGQVRRAFQFASEEGLVGRMLGTAFKRALRVGKRARSETGIGRNPTSISSAAVELAVRALQPGGLAGKRVVIVGAGEMGRLAARAVGSAGAGDVVIVNRTRERADELAQAFNATARPFDELEAVFAEADVVISSTTAPGTVIDKRMVERALSERDAERSLFIVDIAVPRDVEPDVAELDGVVARDIEDLRELVESSVGGRADEVSVVEEIIAGEVKSFAEWERAAEAAPTASALVARADEIRRGELERISARLADLSPEDRAAIDHLTRRIVAKILHAPLAKSRELASSEQGSAHLQALRALFDLEDD